MDYAPIQAFLVGRCRKTLREAAMTPLLEYELLMEGENQMERSRWEKVRWLAFMECSISPNLKRRPHRPQDIMAFPWEKEDTAEVKEVEPISEEEIKGLCEIFNINREDVTNGQDK